MPNDHAIFVDGKVQYCDMMTWAKWFESSHSQRIVARTELPNYLVSTVFLGLNHGWGDTELWFETMVFTAGGGEDCERYTTLEEAKAGHERMVEKWSKPQPEEAHDDVQASS